jgi:hypothetical protein
MGSPARRTTTTVGATRKAGHSGGSTASATMCHAPLGTALRSQSIALARSVTATLPNSTPSRSAGSGVGVAGRPSCW